MSMKERTQRLKLTIFFSVVVFCTLLLTMATTGLLVYFFNRWGLFIPDGQREIGLLRAIILLQCLSLVVGTALTFVVIRIPLTPISTFLDGMRKLAEGNYKTRIDMGPIGKQSLGNDLADSFNTLAAELENTEMLRSDFINNFSHEFKTPIVSIAGFAKLLKRGNLSEEQKREYLDIIEEESLRLSYMATNVLNLTKIENQAILRDLSAYNLSEQLRNCVLMLENRWVRKNVDFELDFDELTVNANEEFMMQVWINLIDNAVKFSPVGSTVEIDARKENGCVIVRISNEGEAIPEESRGRIFNKFYQLDESHATKGNGIGLAIVKRITELHKGSVRVECSKGKIHFFVSIPTE